MLSRRFVLTNRRLSADVLAVVCSSPGYPRYERMGTVHRNQITLPDWLQRALDEGKPIDEPLYRRADPRRTWSGVHAIVDFGDPRIERTSVRAMDISSGGVGCISRWELMVGKEYDLVPVEEIGEPVRVRVVHSTWTKKGYKIGFAFVPQGA